MGNAGKILKKALAVFSTAALLMTCGATGAVTAFTGGITASAASATTATQLRIYDENGNDLGDNPVIYLDTSEAAGVDDTLHNVSRVIKAVLSDQNGVAVDEEIKAFVDGDTDEYLSLSLPSSSKSSITARLAGGHYMVDDSGELFWVEKSPGTTHIRFTSSDGKLYRVVTVNVLRPAKDLKIYEITGNSRGELDLGEFNHSNTTDVMVIANHKYQFEAELDPVDSTDTVDWKVYDGTYNGTGNPKATSLAEITEEGLFTPKKNGSVTIVVKCKPTETTNREYGIGLKAFYDAEQDQYVLKPAQAIPKYIHVTIVKDNPAKSLKITNAPSSIKLGNSFQLKYEATPTYTGDGYETGITDTLVWKSSDENVLTVDSKGLIRAVGNGDAAVTLYGENQNVFATANIRVVTPATSISFPVQTVSTKVGSTTTIKAIMSPAAADEAIVWSSSDTSVATVKSSVTGQYTNEQTAVITGLKAGATQITAKAKNSGVSASITCNVEDKVVSSDVKLTYKKNGKIIQIAEGDVVNVYDQNTITISGALLSASGASPDDTIVWKVTGNGVNNNNYVDVISQTDSEITMTGFAKGTITVTASSKANSAVKKTFKLSVLKRATIGTIYDTATGSSDFRTSINVGTTMKLGADLRIDSNQPHNHDDVVESWTSSAPKVITIDNNGNLKAVGNGEATITMTTASGGKQYAYFTSFTTSSIVLRGVEASSSGGLPFVNVDLDSSLSGTVTLSADVYNERDVQVNDVNIKWSSSKESVATVDQSGNVTVHQVGNATITVKSGNKSDSCIVKACYPMSNASVVIPDVYYSPKTTAYKPKLMVVSGDPNGTTKQTLVAGVDYTVTYTNNTKVGDTATVTVTGKGNYTGSFTGNFTILARPITDPVVTMSPISSQELTSANKDNGAVPAVKLTQDGYVLKKGTDYTLECSSNTSPGEASLTINGIGNYSGSITIPYKVYCNHKDCTVSVDTPATCTQAGHATVYCNVCGAQFDRELPVSDHKFKPYQVVEPTYISDGYTVYQCENCDKTEKRDYVPALSRINAKFCTVTLDKTVFTYNGNVQVPEVTVSCNGTSLYESTDYTLSYTNRNSKATGDYKVNVVFRGAYTGTTTVKYSIVPAATAIQLDKTSLKIKAGESASLSVTTAPAKAAAGVEWSSSDEYTAAVSAAGRIMALSPGTAEITARSGNVTAVCTVTVTEAPFSNDSVLSETTIKLGQTAEAVGMASGGKTPYKFALAYMAPGSTSWTVVKDFGTTSVMTFKPKSTGVYVVRIKAKDAGNRVTYKDYELTVTPALKNLSDVSDTTVMMGESIDVIGYAEGGEAPYEFEMSYKKSTLNNWTVLQTYSTNPVVKFTPKSVGTYGIKIKVRDYSGKVLVKTINVTAVSALKGTGTVSPTKADLGSAFTVKCAATGGVAPYQYKVDYKKSGAASWMSAQAFSTNATVKITPQSVAYYEVQVTVKDARGKLAYQIFNIRTLQALANNSTISAEKITLGGYAVVNMKASGGEGMYKYAVSYKSASATTWTAVQAFTVNKTVSIQPKTSGTFSIRTTVKDAGGKTAIKTFTLKVVSRLYNQSTISASKITLGKTVTVNCKATGGEGSYKYLVKYRKKGTTSWLNGQDYSTNASVTITPQAAVEYEGYVKVKDAGGTVVEKTFEFTVVKPLVNESTLSASTVKRLNSITVKCKASGGEDYYKYTVLQKRSGVSNWTTIQSYNANPDVVFTPQYSGTYTIQVKVKDLGGRITIKNLTLTVTK